MPKTKNLPRLSEEDREALDIGGIAMQGVPGGDPSDEDHAISALTQADFDKACAIERRVQHIEIDKSIEDAIQEQMGDRTTRHRNHCADRMGIGHYGGSAHAMRTGGSLLSQE